MLLCLSNDGPVIRLAGFLMQMWHICPEVCPFNLPPAESSHPTVVPTSEPSFQPRAATTGRTLEELSLLTEEEFREQFKGSAVKRAKWRGLLRNVAIALTASDDSGAVRSHSS